MISLCEECGNELEFSISDYEEFKHILEHCRSCGWNKGYVDYIDEDTGPINWSGIEH